MSDIKYRQPDKRDLEELIKLSKQNIGMTDIYTYIKLYEELPKNSRLWIGESENGAIVTLFYDDGSYITRNDCVKKTFTAARSVKDGTLFDIPKRENRLAVMEYKGGRFSRSEKAVSLTGKDILSALRLMSGKENLPDYLEKRYVDTARGVNAGLCDYRGIYTDGELVSCGGIVASNEKYALIGNIFTKEEYRNRGSASEIINTLIAAAKEKDLIPILYCEKEMTGFYRKIGFKET